MDTTGTLFFPPGGSTLAADVDALFYFIYYASAVIFAVVMAATIWFVFRYRRRKIEKTDSKDHSLWLEITWTAIPTILILIVFIWGFRTYIRMTVVPKDALEVKVTGQKWFWSFDYEGGANSVSELVVPVGQPIKLLMSSRDVIHSFFVPSFRMKMDVLPNRYSVTWFEATRTGEFDLFCTEYCGTGHSEMIGKVRVLGEREFNEWLEAGSGPAEGESLADYGKTLFVRKACITCHSVDGSKNVGPTFLGIYGRDEAMADGARVTVDENYIRESILNPQAKIVAGYEPVMPTYQGILKDRDIDAIIAYLKSLKAE